jgi:hypothetical protein
MSEAMDLEQIIADWRGDAAVLRRRGDARSAAMLEQCATQAAGAAEEWLLWLSEGDAMVRAGKSAEWLRARFEAWRRDGHATQSGRFTRLYRAAIIPRRADTTTATRRGRDAARSLERAS